MHEPKIPKLSGGLMELSRPRGKDLLAFLIVTVAYVVGGKIGLRFASVNASATAVWPPTGIALAAFLLLGPRIWPAVLLGAFLVNVTTAGTAATSLGIAVGNTLEGALGSHLVRRFAGGRKVFDQPSSIFKFAALAGMLAPAVSATIGVATLLLGGLARGSEIGPIWITWWLGDASGALVVTPLVVLWWLDHEFVWTLRRGVEYAGLLLTLLAAAFFVFSSGSPVGGKRYPIQYLCLPPLLWSSFRFGQRESAAALTLLTGIAIQGTLSGHGPFTGRPLNESFLLLQGFMAVLSVTMVATAAAVVGRRRVEMSVRQLNEQAEVGRKEAEEANRLKDEFLAILSHELRTPLNAIAGWANLLQEGKLDPAMTARAVETIDRNVKIQSHLISDILDISRMTSGRLELKRQPVRIATVIEGVLDTMRPAAEGRSVHLKRDRIDPQSTVLGDPDRLQQIVWNLLSNAIKFAPPNGQVTIRATREESAVRIQVEDDGPGIDPEFLPYIFERFRQSDATGTRHHGGLGLGLAIVKRLVELHHGSVSASNRPGRGASFEVLLPLADAAEPRRPVTVTTGPAGSRDGKDPARSLIGRRILLVEDERDSRELIAMFLSGCGADVESVSSADEALRAFARRTPDILISDIAMPEKSGYDLIRELRSMPREKGGGVPAVALTAYAASEDVDKALRAGFDVHMAKPVEMRELARRAADLLAGARMH